MRKRFFIKRFLEHVCLLLIPVLLIGPYGIVQMNRESRRALERNSYNVLYQIDETMNSLLGELDHIYYYVRSNPSIATSLKNAYNEPELTLGSLRNISQICSLLRYYTYTSEYIDTIYVYYYNENNRILVPEKGMVSRDAHRDTGWIEEAETVESDIWLDARMISKDSYSDPVPVIYYFRKLYSTIDPSNPVGIIAIEYDGKALGRFINSMSLYEGQTLAVQNQGIQTLVQNNQEELSDLFQSMSEAAAGEFLYYDSHMAGESYTVSRLQSQYVQDLSYVSAVPTRNVFHTAGQFARIFLLLVGGAIGVSFLLAYVRAKKDYKNLEQILDLLSNPQQAVHRKADRAEAMSDPYNYITYNIINLFLQQDYLKIQTSEQKYKLQALELFALQQQINPHFLHNTLNTIYWEAIGLTKGPNTCSEMLTKLSSIMRYSLGKPEEAVTIEEELRYLKSYVYIQTKRHNQKFSVTYEADDQVSSYLIRKMILQPLVENAISHGVKRMSGNGRIRLKIHRMRSWIYISVLDNGEGMTAEIVKNLKESLEVGEGSGAHVGLVNVHRRLVLTYGPEAGLHIVSHEGRGTCVFFRIPDQKNDSVEKNDRK